MPITICNAFAAGCTPDWDGVSAVATAAATAAALFIPSWQRRKDAQERRKALGYSLLLKMMKIHSDVYKLWEHVLEQRDLAKAHDAPPKTWGFFRPLANLPTPVIFSTDELAMLFAAGDDDAFNAVLSMDEVHASVIATMGVYAEKRDSLSKMLPGGELNGLVGSVDLKAEEIARFAPFAAQLDMLVADFAASIERHSAQTEDALRQLHGVVRSKIGLKIGYTLPDGTTFPKDR